MAWMLQSIETEADGQGRSLDILEISRPKNLRTNAPRPLCSRAQQAQRGRTVLRFHDLVAELAKVYSGDGAHHGFVLDQQHRLA